VTAAGHGGNAPPPAPLPSSSSTSELAPASEPNVERELELEARPALPMEIERAPAPALLERPEPSWRELGWWLALSESGSDSEKARGGAAALRLYYVHRLGLPLWSAAELSLIGGKLVVSAKLLRAIALQRGYRVTPYEATDERCTAVLIRTRTGEEIGRYTFTLEDAHRAGLMRARSAWTTHPKRMLWARAAKFVLDDFAPDVSLGMHTTDELAEIRAGEPEPIGIDTEPPYGGSEDLRERDEDIPF
jgi:hypothetical protein